jgi:phosphoglycolate phosphatase-like HAD superfamily hydrolase
MLILFDIDATLITTSRAGMAAMEDAGRELFGPAFTTERTEFAGRLDPLILADLLRDNGVEVTAQSLAAMRDGYRRHLPGKLKERRCAACPGVPELLATLAGREGLVLGLLTGNYADTGEIKLRACGVDPGRFVIRVWGDESPHPEPSRDHLPAIGLARYRERFGPIEPRRVTIIGDTPHDVACARAHGCRSLGVGTGMHAPEVLLRAGADRAVKDLSATADVLGWLMSDADRTRMMI